MGWTRVGASVFIQLQKCDGTCQLPIMSKWLQGPQQGANTPQASWSVQTVPGLGKRCGAGLVKWSPLVQQVESLHPWLSHYQHQSDLAATAMAPLKQLPSTWAEVLLGPIAAATSVPKTDFQQLQLLLLALVQAAEGAGHMDPWG